MIENDIDILPHTPAVYFQKVRNESGVFVFLKTFLIKDFTSSLEDL